MADIEISDDKLLTEELTENDRMTMVSMGTRKFATMKVGRFIAWLAKLMPVASPTSPGLMSAADRQHIGESPFSKMMHLRTHVNNKKKLRINIGRSGSFRSLKVTITGEVYYGGGRIEKVFNTQYGSAGYTYDSGVTVMRSFPSDAIYVSNVLVIDGSCYLDVVCKNVRFDNLRDIGMVFEFTETITATPREPLTFTSMDATDADLAKSNSTEVPWAL